MCDIAMTAVFVLEFVFISTALQYLLYLVRSLIRKNSYSDAPAADECLSSTFTFLAPYIIKQGFEIAAIVVTL